MLRNVQLCRYKVPTPIQAYVLPSVFKNTDIIGIAQTGKSGLNSSLHRKLTASRLWQDRRLSHSRLVQTHGEGEEVGGPPSRPHEALQS